MTQQAGNLLINLEDHADGLKFLIRDRDAKFTAMFDAVLTAIGVRIIKNPHAGTARMRSPNGGSPAPAAMCLDRMLITGEWHLRLILSEHVDHYNNHRPYRTLQQNPPVGRVLPPDEGMDTRVGPRDRLGGLIHEYAQVAYGDTVVE